MSSLITGFSFGGSGMSGNSGSSAGGCGMEQKEFSWVEASVIPLTFLTMALFVLDIAQRLNPYKKSRKMKEYQNGWKAPRVRYDYDVVEYGSNFAKRSTENGNKRISKRRTRSIEDLNPFEEKLNNILNSIQNPN